MTSDPHVPTQASRRQKIAALATVTVVGGTLVVNGTPVDAATFEVTNLDPSGPGSFAQAVLDANAASDGDQIRFAPGLNGTIELDSESRIKYDLAIIGSGDGSITMTNDSGDILYLYNGASLSVSGVSFADANDTAIEARNAGNLTLSDLDVSGGRRFVRFRDSANLTVTDSTISGVTSTGLYSRNTGHVVMSGLDITDDGDPNTFSYSSAMRLYSIQGNVSLTSITSVTGIGIRKVQDDGGSNRGDVTLNGIVIESEDYGASLYTSRVDGQQTVSNVSVSGDEFASVRLSAQGDGGGINAVTVDSVTVSVEEGSGVLGLSRFSTAEVSNVVVEGSLYVSGVDDAVISESTLVGRDLSGKGRRFLAKDDVDELVAESDTFRRDGRIITVARSTVSFSQVTASGHTAGSALILYGSDVSFEHSTIGGNTLSGPTVIVDGGVDASSLDLDHTIFSDLTDQSFEFAQQNELYGPRKVDSDVLVVTADHSVLPTDVVTDYTLGASNVETDDVRLGPLSDAIGPLPTASPLAGSPAIDAGDPSIADAPDFDQRGEPRIVDVIDIGAVETTPLFTSIVPARLVDTRSGEKTIDRKFEGAGKRQPGSKYVVDIAGRAGVPADATAVVMNVTAVGPEGVGFITIFACDDDQPDASSLNFNGTNVGNEVIAGLAADGSVCIFVQGTAHLTVDVVAYATRTSSIKPVTPARSFESRIGKNTADGRYQGAGKLAAGSQTTVKIAGRNGVPADAAAVVVNITAIRADGGGYMTVHPCLSKLPNASSLNFEADEVRANEVVAQLNEFGELCVFTSAASDLAIDVVAYLPIGAIESVAPSRLLDTRSTGKTVDGKSQAGGRVTAESTTTLKVAGRGNVPAGVKAVVINVTAIRPDARGFVTVDACETPRPKASSLNYEPGVNTPNEIIAGVNDDGEICLFTQSATDLAVDVVAFIR